MQICYSLTKWKGVIALAFVFVVNVSVAPPLSLGSRTSWCLLVVSCQDWPVDHACRLARGQVFRHGQSQGATCTGAFQDFIVWALMPRPKLKSRGAIYSGNATFAGGFMVFCVVYWSRQLSISVFNIAFVCSKHFYCCLINTLRPE